MSKPIPVACRYCLKQNCILHSFSSSFFNENNCNFLYKWCISCSSSYLLVLLHTALKCSFQFKLKEFSEITSGIATACLNIRCNWIFWQNIWYRLANNRDEPSFIFSNLLAKQLMSYNVIWYFFLEKSLPDLVMLFVCMPFNFQMICSVSSFTYGRLIIFFPSRQYWIKLTIHKAWDALHYMTPHWFIDRNSIYWNSFRVKVRSKDDCAILWRSQRFIFHFKEKYGNTDLMKNVNENILRKMFRIISHAPFW